MSEKYVTAQVIELRCYYELSVFQIAKRMGLTVLQVETYLAKYTQRPKYNMALSSRANLSDRSWFIYINRNKLSTEEMAKQFGLAERTIRRLATGFQRKKHIFLKNNNSKTRVRKLCLNTETGIYYNSATEAALSCTHRSQTHIQAMINGFKRNFTSIRLV